MKQKDVVDRLNRIQEIASQGDTLPVSELHWMCEIAAASTAMWADHMEEAERLGMKEIETSNFKSMVRGLELVYKGVNQISVGISNWKIGQKDKSEIEAKLRAARSQTRGRKDK